MCLFSSLMSFLSSSSQPQPYRRIDTDTPTEERSQLRKDASANFMEEFYGKMDTATALGKQISQNRSDKIRSARLTSSHSSITSSHVIPVMYDDKSDLEARVPFNGRGLEMTSSATKTTVVSGLHSQRQEG